MGVREMAEAHLKNVQNQLGELQNQKKRVEAEIQQLTEYLQKGVNELNVTVDSQQEVEEAPTPSLSLDVEEGEK
jgi:hypothetical protein